MPIYHPAMETLPRPDLEQLQVERLQVTLNRVYRNVAFYRQRFDQLGLDVGRVRDLAALADLPFTTKEDLRASYPYDLFAVPLRDIARIHSTSGTTGSPIGVGYTAGDLARWAELTARVLVSAGIDHRDFVQLAFHQLATGLFGFQGGAEKLGATLIPASLPDLHEQLRIMRDYKSTALVTTPTYALRVALAMEEMGLRPQALNLRTLLLGGEAWSENLRRDLEQRLQVTAYDNYGLSEVMGPGIAGECSARQGLHVQEDHFLAEVVDPATGRPQPPGQEGELVFTTLAKEAFPLIRYRTGDLASLLPGACSCGRTFVRMSRVHGRCDDLLIVGGTKFFPARLAELLLQVEGLSPQAELVLTRSGATDQLEVRAEIAPEFALLDEIKNLERLRQELRQRVQLALGLEPRITLVEHGTLVRAGGKRVITVTDRRTS